MRSYHQVCPAATALDIVGERWSLLIIRDLLRGPKRYTDLQQGLPGIGPNVLAERLRSLEAAGLIGKKRLQPPAASTVYELTELGSGLRPALMELFRWGMQVVGSPAAEDTLKAGWWIPALEARLGPQALAPPVEDTYELRIGQEVITIAVQDGEVELREGPAEEPDVVISTDRETFVAIGTGRIAPLAAIESGRMTVEGDPAAAERCAALFGVADAAALSGDAA